MPVNNVDPRQKFEEMYEEAVRFVAEHDVMYEHEKNRQLIRDFNELLIDYTRELLEGTNMLIQ